MYKYVTSKRTVKQTSILPIYHVDPTANRNHRIGFSANATARRPLGPEAQFHWSIFDYFFRFLICVALLSSFSCRSFVSTLIIVLLIDLFH
ncbi:hypothetical protein T03_12744 [Trichinella britovi]|uniref:Uncharacterized protein n=1 Tax=Trichinella britovi TaxID=45882 RepID=A0A0V1CBX1_TRIBR|nr:hypothetical protein T03_12744 [Trichinella britovi]KRZ85364.1 hypothetical protein T08_1437 [Trichinella sp. T8]